MPNDNRINDAIAAGERNAEAMKLMHNWCAHARAKRMGGVGMIEQMTGLPISHFSMECDHTPTDGMAAWDFGEAALDFHDRNCVACTVRQPVAIPNLSKLVAARDEARRKAGARARADRMEAELALNQRSQARFALRSDLDAVNQALIDDLDSFDRDHKEVDRQRLVEAARMAPERLDKRLTDLIFEQSAKSTSLAPLALDVGIAVAPNERRLMLLAQRLFRNGLAEESAPQVIIANLAGIAEDDVVALVPEAARLASPDHRDSWHGGEARTDSSLLLAMWNRAQMP